MLDFVKKGEVLFEKLLKGEEDIFLEIMELEKSNIYDYLFRMTGQSDFSARVLDEVCVALSDDAAHFSSYYALRVAVYSTVRSFAASYWNAQTNKLINKGYEKAELSEDIEGELKTVEHIFMGLAGWEREALLLQYRYGFFVAQVAEIMSMTESSVYSLNTEGFKTLINKTEFSQERLIDLISLFPYYAISFQSLNSTVAFSQMMSDLSKTRGFDRRRRMWVWLTLVLIGLGWLAYKYKSYWIQYVDIFIKR